MKCMISYCIILSSALIYSLFSILVSDIKGKHNMKVSETGSWGEYKDIREEVEKEREYYIMRRFIIHTLY